MNNFRKSLVSEIFVVATGFAALVHSTWSIGTLFSGQEPIWYPTQTFLEYIFAYLCWMVPALLIAFALDIGQIATSHEIRECIARNERPIRKYVTFGIFAVATYYLQWLYMMNHIPLLALGGGVSALHTPLVEALRDLSVWIVPAFLPLSTLLYTYSHVKAEEKSIEKSITPIKVTTPVMVINADRGLAIRTHETRVSPTGNYTGETLNAITIDESGLWTYTCPHCGKVQGGYETELNARKACGVHVGRWCEQRVLVQNVPGDLPN